MLCPLHIHDMRLVMLASDCLLENSTLHCAVTTFLDSAMCYIAEKFQLFTEKTDFILAVEDSEPGCNSIRIITGKNNKCPTERSDLNCNFQTCK